jgi:hypothetical protein
MALVFQPMSHNIVSDGSENESEQNQDDNRFNEARLLVLVHKFITVL